PSRIYNYELTSYLELGSMLTLAEIVASAAQNRTESRGAHHRADFPERDETNWKSPTVATLAGGSVQFQKKPIASSQPRGEELSMEVTFKVYRKDPEKDGKPGRSNYTVEVAESATVLDALLKIRDEVDSTLAFRASCAKGYCGECMVRVNGSARLCCTAKV